MPLPAESPPDQDPAIVEVSSASEMASTSGVRSESPLSPTNAQVIVLSASTFTLFPKLPPEIRHEIWRMAMPNGGRLLSCHPPVRHRQYWQSPKSGRGPRVRSVILPVSFETITTYRLPDIVMVCLESYNVLSKEFDGFIKLRHGLAGVEATLRARIGTQDVIRIDNLEGFYMLEGDRGARFSRYIKTSTAGIHTIAINTCDLLYGYDQMVENAALVLSRFSDLTKVIIFSDDNDDDDGGDPVELHHLVQLNDEDMKQWLWPQYIEIANELANQLDHLMSKKQKNLDLAIEFRKASRTRVVSLNTGADLRSEGARESEAEAATRN